MNDLIKRVLGESVIQQAEPQEIIEGQRVEYFDICPHCKDEIYERHVYFDGPDNDKAFHSDCKGPIIWPRKRIREEQARVMSNPNSFWAKISNKK